jgi:hypothetical protein
MALKRSEHWATRAFHKFLLARAKTPFVWGETDCALFCADGIQAITGVDIASDFRGKYQDEAGAIALIKTVTGGSTIVDAAAWCAQKHGLVECIHPLMARRGDLVIVQSGGVPISGLVHLSGRHVVAQGEKGLMRLSISAIERSWHYE